MFDLDRFVQDCTAALDETAPEMAVRELVAAAVADPADVMRTLGEPERGGVYTLHHSDRLTVLNLVWGPGMELMPHDHRMWAAIGIYTGRETNVFWRRDGAGLQRMGGKELGEREAVWLGATAIHSVANPLGRLTGALHVYGGDFFGTPRSEWDGEPPTEAAYDVAKIRRLFDESNRRLAPEPGA